MKNRVFKFGGASISNSNLIQKVVHIILNEQPNLVVFSATGKTTNALENALGKFFSGEDYESDLNEIRAFHLHLIQELMKDKHNEATESLDKIFNYCTDYLNHAKEKDYDEVYDQIIPIGELLSSKILFAYLKTKSNNINWLDARSILKTDNRFRKAEPDIENSKKHLNEKIQKGTINVIQGFIGGTNNQLMTTIGREGSDYSAALFAHFTNADSLTVWKDVDGVLNADPRYFNHTQLVEHISYKEAIELSYYGATIIHPKTIQPLLQKQIPLFVKSFLNPESKGTLIDLDQQNDNDHSFYIYKPNQLLITLTNKDFSFFGEHEMASIYHHLFEHKLEVNLVQNSAINCSICIDTDPQKTASLLEALSQNYKVLYNNELELLTVRHYNKKFLNELITGKDIIIEQRTRNTLKLLFRTTHQSNT